MIHMLQESISVFEPSFATKTSYFHGTIKGSSIQTSQVVMAYPKFV